MTIVNCIPTSHQSREHNVNRALVRFSSVLRALVKLCKGELPASRNLNLSCNYNLPNTLKSNKRQQLQLLIAASERRERLQPGDMQGLVERKQLVPRSAWPYLCAPSLPKCSDLQVSADELTQVGMTIFGSIDTCGCVVLSSRIPALQRRVLTKRDSQL